MRFAIAYYRRDELVEETGVTREHALAIMAILGIWPAFPLSDISGMWREGLVTVTRVDVI